MTDILITILALLAAIVLVRWAVVWAIAIVRPYGEIDALLEHADPEPLPICPECGGKNFEYYYEGHTTIGRMCTNPKCHAGVVPL